MRIADVTRIDDRRGRKRGKMNVDLKHSELTEKLINTYYALYNELGFGFLESVYQKAFALMHRKRSDVSGADSNSSLVSWHGYERVLW
jgi:PD-(D/E)XK nuclease superfamily